MTLNLQLDIVNRLIKLLTENEISKQRSAYLCHYAELIPELRAKAEGEHYSIRLFEEVPILYAELVRELGEPCEDHWDNAMLGSSHHYQVRIDFLNKVKWIIELMIHDSVAAPTS